MGPRDVSQIAGKGSRRSASCRILVDAAGCERVSGVKQLRGLGMRKEDLELTVEGNRLKISGHRPDGCRAPKCTFLVMEINYGAFESIIEVPPGYDMSQAKAAYQNGFLRIDVPELTKSSQKSISVSIPSGER